MENKKRKLIIVDGMPGSGKTTYATEISNYLDGRKIKHRCVLALEQEHPLFLHNENIEELSDDMKADDFIKRIDQLYRNFVVDRLSAPEQITIIESSFFQDTISTAYHLGMNKQKLLNFYNLLMEIVTPLNPSLIYFYQIDVEGQWRFICNIRGNVWGSVSLYTEEDFEEAGLLWSGSQTFVRKLIDELPLPKLIIENIDYHWEEYRQRIISFVKSIVDEEVYSAINHQKYK